MTNTMKYLFFPFYRWWCPLAVLLLILLAESGMDAPTKTKLGLVLVEVKERHGCYQGVGWFEFFGDPAFLAEEEWRKGITRLSNSNSHGKY